jgi:hypothetical protein
MSVPEGGLQMPSYWLYRVDRAGHIQGPPIFIEALDDNEAVKRAQEYGGQQKIELWQGTRLVMKCAQPGTSQ